MDDQALDTAVAPDVESRIAAALGGEPDRVNLEPPPPTAEFQSGAVDGAPTNEAAPTAKAEPSAEAATDDSIKWDEVREIKVRVPIKNGAEEKEIEASLEELRLGYMRQDDYQRKTQEVARARDQHQTELQKAIALEQQRVSQHLKTYEATLNSIAMQEFQNVDWNRLAADDPAAFVQLSHRANQIRTAMGNVKQQLQAVEAQKKAAENQQRAQAIAQAAEQLKAEIPNWGEELQTALVKTGSAMGFTQEELSGVHDPRFVKLLLKAHQFDGFSAKESLAEKKVADAPRVLKPSAPQSKGTGSAQADALKAKIKKSGGTDKAAVEEFLKIRLRRS